MLLGVHVDIKRKVKGKLSKKAICTGYLYLTLLGRVSRTLVGPEGWFIFFPAGNNSK